jgi:polyamine oxidase
MQVTHVSYGDNGVTVTTSSGQQFQSDRVIITVPLSLLKQRRIEFSPELPAWKLKAIDTLGVGMLEKVMSCSVLSFHM